MTIPTCITKFAGKTANWLVKNGPTLMSVAGGAMAVGGAVMACEATLHADEILERHRQRMAKIDAAVALNDIAENAEDVYTEKQRKHDKTVVYFETARDFARLYLPAVSVGLSGIGLMQGAFYISERRRAAAVAALTTLDQAYQNLLCQTNTANGYLPEGNPSIKEIESKDDGELGEKLVLDPDKNPDPFFFVFDNKNPNWYGSKGFLLNERFISATIDAFNYRLSGYSTPQVWVTDILKGLDIPQEDYTELYKLGSFYGWNALAGDSIEYDIVPLLRVVEDSDDETPYLIETDIEAIRELEVNDIQDGYCFGIRLKSSSDGESNLVPPRFIWNEVYGN